MNKVLSTIFSAFLVLTCISPVSADDSIQEVSPTLETEEVIKEPASDTPQPVEIDVSEPPAENAETAISTQSTETDLCNISAFEIDERKDGTAPFDSNDDAGNDSGDSNGIVRTFDSVNYTRELPPPLRRKP